MRLARSARRSRSARVLLVAELYIAAAAVACAPQAPPELPPAKCPPLPSATGVSAEAPLNSTQLVVEPLATPSSKMSVHFATPDLGQTIPEARAAEFEVRLTAESAEGDALGIDVALDGERPRRLSVASPALALGALLRPDAPLTAGDHWLFAAPVLASGLVPQPGPGLPRAAVARRFFVAKVPDESGGPSGAVWLRKPDGTYNGSASAHVVFDSFAFNATGALVETPCTIALADGAPGTSGELRQLAPFSVRDVPSGEYALSVSAPRARAVSLRFTVNRELGGGP